MLGHSVWEKNFHFYALLAKGFLFCIVGLFYHEGLVLILPRSLQCLQALPIHLFEVKKSPVAF